MCSNSLSRMSRIRRGFIVVSVGLTVVCDRKCVPHPGLCLVLICTTTPFPYVQVSLGQGCTVLRRWWYCSSGPPCSFIQSLSHRRAVVKCQTPVLPALLLFHLALISRFHLTYFVALHIRENFHLMLCVLLKCVILTSKTLILAVALHVGPIACSSVCEAIHVYTARHSLRMLPHHGRDYGPPTAAHQSASPIFPPLTRGNRDLLPRRAGASDRQVITRRSRFLNCQKMNLPCSFFRSTRQGTARFHESELNRPIGREPCPAP